MGCSFTIPGAWGSEKPASSSFLSSSSSLVSGSGVYSNQQEGSPRTPALGVNLKAGLPPSPSNDLRRISPGHTEPTFLANLSGGSSFPGTGPLWESLRRLRERLKKKECLPVGTAELKPTGWSPEPLLLPGRGLFYS